MCVLRGFPTTLAKSKTNTSFPFGIWFANPHTLYVADEGDGSSTFSTASGQYTDAAAQTTAGLQKWVFDPASESNITGRVNRDGTVTVWAVTSTVSGSGDQGADPNQVVSITDDPTATSPGSERFEQVIAPRYGRVLRGVTLAPHGELTRRR
jgi:hypothetical protein